MKLLSTITTVSFSVAIAAAAGVGAPIKARQDRSILMFTGTGFTGTAENFSGDVCSPVVEPYVSNLRSAIATPASVCLLFTSGSCSSCAACVDDAGFSDMTKVPAVHSFRCETADAKRCSDANCTFK